MQELLSNAHGVIIDIVDDEDAHPPTRCPQVQVFAGMPLTVSAFHSDFGRQRDSSYPLNVECSSTSGTRALCTLSTAEVCGIFRLQLSRSELKKAVNKKMLPWTQHRCQRVLGTIMVPLPREDRAFTAFHPTEDDPCCVTAVGHPHQQAEILILERCGRQKCQWLQVTGSDPDRET